MNILVESHCILCLSNSNCCCKHQSWVYGRRMLSQSMYFQLKKKLENEFPRCPDICGEGTPQATVFFEVMVVFRSLLHYEKRGNGSMDRESKFLQLVAAIKATFRAKFPKGRVQRLWPRPLGKCFTTG
ncbi:LOW QUALITY PROTEIN: selenoprotein W [Lemur catta]|uniref:LOW QUALITY PROTEIN: selenoprotein W n=1 Tax=Lemur catta TaxID=9447 RepID=UPI001E269E68|nr:LOW QUALITY PROTEIN: selenoprotein W [Lemur catta]